MLSGKGRDGIQHTCVHTYKHTHIDTQSQESEEDLLSPSVKKMLVVTVVEAKGLIAADASGFSDPFVSLTIEEEDEKEVSICMRLYVYMYTFVGYMYIICLCR